MALINCPECNKEISDKVKNCPHCGYPLIDNDDTQKVEVTSVKLQINKEKPKKIIAALVGIVVIASIIFMCYSSSKQNQYSKDFNAVLEGMFASGSEAEDLIKLTSNVWHNAIYEERDSKTDKYTYYTYGSGSLAFNFYDFNTALQNLYADEDTKTTITNIKSSQENVASLMKKLKNPPDKYKASYETLIEMYNAYQGITNLAINPKGNLQTFQNNANEKIDNFVGSYEKLQTQLPD